MLLLASVLPFTAAAAAASQPPNTCGAAIAQQCGLMRGAPGTSAPAEGLACAAQHQQALRAQQEAALKAEIRRLERGARRDGLNMEYLKNIVVSFIESGDAAERARRPREAPERPRTAREAREVSEGGRGAA